MAHNHNGADAETPTFIKAWLKDALDEYDDHWFNIFPRWFLLGFALAGIVSYYLPAGFWIEKRDSTVVYTGLLTLNGIVLALSWSAFAKIYETIGASNFALFLKEKGMLESYLFLIRFVHAFQMLGLIASAGALVFLQFDVSVLWQRVVFAIALGSGAYAIKQAAGAVTVMQDLVRYRAIFDADRADRPPLRDVK
jgi:hypothetical protein